MATVIGKNYDFIALLNRSIFKTKIIHQFCIRIWWMVERSLVKSKFDAYNGFASFLNDLAILSTWLCWKNSLKESSVTRFGEISPLWQNILRLRQNLSGLFSIWQNFEPILAKVLFYWANYHYCKWPNNEKII